MVSSTRSAPSTVPFPHRRYPGQLGHRRAVRGARVRRGRPGRGRKAPARISNASDFHGSPGRHPQRGVRPLGILTFGPWLSRDIDPISPTTFPTSPCSASSAVMSPRRGPAGGGPGTRGDDHPIVAATTRDLLRQVPRLPKRGAGLGDERLRDGAKGQPSLDPGRAHRRLRPGPGPGARRDHPDQRAHS